MIELESVRMKFPEDTNIIIGQPHFIKTAEDMYEAVVNTVPQAKFGLAGPSRILSTSHEQPGPFSQSSPLP